MFRSWVWLIPCWVWKYFFRLMSKERIVVRYQTRGNTFLVPCDGMRLDDEFVLLRYPRLKVYHIKGQDQFGEPREEIITIPVSFQPAEIRLGTDHESATASLHGKPEEQTMR